jgi:hypothetical protein
MNEWIGVFVVVAAVAIVIQMLILLGMFLELRKANERITRIATDLEARVNPILTRLDRLLEDSQGRITSIVADSAEIVHLARSQAQKFDRVFSEAVERLRLQVIRADQLLTGALEAVEEAGSQFRKSIWGPVHQASALLRGVKTSLDFIRGQRRSPERAREQQDEGLFI